MARAINIIFELKDAQGNYKQFDINSIGLVSMSFDRFLGNPKNFKSGILSKLDLTVFDKTGYDLLSKLQTNRNNVRLRYGFDDIDGMSDLYNLTVLKFKSTFNNLGCMAAIGAYATQTNISYDSAIYPSGTLVEDILIELAKRNGWYIGTRQVVGNKEKYSNIDCDIILPKTVFKPKGLDIDFIQNELVPLCNMSINNIADISAINDYWEVSLFPYAGRINFVFLPYIKRKTILRVWDYSYGLTTDSRVIRLTNTIDYSFLLDGLTIQVPVTAGEAYLGTEDQLTTTYEQKLRSKWEYIERYLSSYNLPIPNEDEFKLNVQLVYAEEAGNIPEESRIAESIKKAIMTLNSIELEIEGNPKIMPMDLVRLRVKNNDGYDNIASGLWKIVYILENIGLGGYSTTLKLVRDSSDMNISIGNMPGISYKNTPEVS